MRTAENIEGSRKERTRMVVAGCALAILVIAGAVSPPPWADTSPPIPPTDCTDFACEK